MIFLRRPRTELVSSNKVRKTQRRRSTVSLEFKIETNEAIEKEKQARIQSEKENMGKLN